jgi:hypothetical protein
MRGDKMSNNYVVTAIFIVLIASFAAMAASKSKPQLYLYTHTIPLKGYIDATQVKDGNPELVNFRACLSQGDQQVERRDLKAIEGDCSSSPRELAGGLQYYTVTRVPSPSSPFATVVEGSSAQKRQINPAQWEKLEAASGKAINVGDFLAIARGPNGEMFAIGQ